MFTGIVTGIGTIIAADSHSASPDSQHGDLRVRIAAPLDLDTITIGASIACSGVCLTVTDRGADTAASKSRTSLPGDNDNDGEARLEESGRSAWFEVDVSGETVSRTPDGMWREGRLLNIEPSLRVGDELGGHIVTGHVDSTGEVTLSEVTGASQRLAIRARPDLAPFIAEKGSITIDGVSLTVNDVRDRPDGACDFLLNIIPHTAQTTTLGGLQVGDAVNIEIDVLARYLMRMQKLAQGR